MSTDVSLAVIAGSLFVIAAVWIAVTRHPSRPSEHESAVVWLRPTDHRIAHAFRTAELHATEPPDVVELALCGWWPVATPVPAAELVTDAEAPRCAACERAVERMERAALRAGARRQ